MVTVLSILVGGICYFILPNNIPLHWTKGVLDFTGSKLFVSLLFPCLLICIFLLRKKVRNTSINLYLITFYYSFFLIQIIVSIFYGIIY